jgi:GNAT superfamily N-acetyltransferase
MRFYHPDRDVVALTELVALCHPTRRMRLPFYWQIIPTIVVDADDGAGLVGYTQFSLAEQTIYLYDTGVHPALRRAGLGRRLMAERLVLGAKLDMVRAIGFAAVGNTPMRMLLAQARFQPTEVIPGYYQDMTPPVDGVRYVSTEASFEWAKAALLDAEPVELEI